MSPWTAKQAVKHNKKAVGKKATQWAATADAVLAKTGDDAKAIKIANSTIKKGRK